MNIHEELKPQNPRQLQERAEEANFQEIRALLEKDIVNALKIANSSLTNKKYFRELLETGLATADASTIEVWLKFLVPRLGIRYILQVLDDRITQDFEQVEKALYWLPKFLNSANKKEMDSVNKLYQKIQQEKIYRGIGRVVDRTGARSS